ncbi:NAD(+)/NADH kinase [bacterium]|nr:NAD(+)/NADH kinase [bacterium]
MKFKNCAIAYNFDNSEHKTICTKLLEEISAFGLRCDVININSLKHDYDLVFVMGGDGTILKAARFYSGSETVIFGINIGRLGFLSQTSKENFSNAFQKIFNGEYKIEKRIMLEANGYNALNDFVIKSKEYGRTSRFSVKIDGKEVCTYVADGVIISTPTGSTAYCLSAGGPVITPNIEAFVIVPVCAHTLTARPLVIPSDSVISVSQTDSKSSKTCVLSVDGQGNYEFKDEITIKKSSRKTNLLILDDLNFYTILQTKLNWGTTPNYC